MADLTLRNVKASPLTNQEVDDNFSNLNDDKVEKSGDTLTGDLAFGDNVKAKFGASDDLQIYHDGSNSIISDAGTGFLVLRGSSFVLMQSDEGENMLRGQKNAQVDLYHNNLVKLSTTSSGVDVTGTLVADGLTVQGPSVTAVVESSSSNAGIRLSGLSTNTSVRNWDIRSNYQAFGDLVFVQGASKGATPNLKRMAINIDGDISFYEDTGTTAKLTWDASAEELKFKDNVIARFGDGDDFDIQHNGTNTFVVNRTGALTLRNTADNSDILIQTDDGSGGVANYFTADGSTGEAQLYHYGSEKLATKSTGIDVTGTVTADGLTLANSTYISQFDNASTSPRIFGINSGNTTYIGPIDPYAGGNILYGVSANVSGQRFYTGANERLRIDSAGDISFYDDSGTSQDLYWDASVSRLGLGTTSPSQALHVQTIYSEILSDGTNNTSSALVAGVSVKANNYRKAGFTIYDESDNEDFFIGRPYASTNQFVISNDTTDRLRINSAGDFILYADDGTSQDFYWDASTSRLGIRTTSPSHDVHIVGNVNTDNSLLIGHQNRTTTGRNSTFLRMQTTARASDGVNRYSRYDFKMTPLNDYGSANLTLKSRVDGIDKPDVLNVRPSGDIEFFAQDGTTSDFYWDKSTSRLGLGTTSPDGLLHIDGISDTVSGLILEAGANTDCRVIDLHNTAGEKRFGFSYDNANIKLSVTDRNETKLLTIQENGRVGIGTTSPSRNLVVNSGSNSGFISIVSSSTQDVGLLLGDSDSDAVCQLKYLNSSNALVINTNGSEAMRIDSSGRLGIGTTSPATTLDVEGTVRAASGSDYTDVKYYGVEFNRTDSYIRPDTDATKNLYIGWDIVNRAWNNVFINGTASTQFYAGASEAARIDSSGRLGINTTTPSTELTVNGTITETSDSTDYNIVSQYDIGTEPNEVPINALLGSMAYQDAEGVNIDELVVNQNLGIGTTAPATALDVSGTITSTGATINGMDVGVVNGGTRYINTHSDSGRLSLHGGASQTGASLYLTGPSYTVANVAQLVASDGVQFFTGGSEAARIDSSGNLLVGRTSNTTTDYGTTVSNDGYISTSRNGNPTAYFNRQTSDGSIVDFRKDGTTVGSIGVASGNLNLESSGSNVIFKIAGTNYYAGNTSMFYPSASSARDLGGASYKWKDLYLSGGVYLGGTGSANLLDDYEEGTWTPVLTMTTSGNMTASVLGASYTKIGRMVHFQCYISAISGISPTPSGEFRLTGLPFASKGSNTFTPINISYASILANQNDVSYGGYVQSGDTFIRFTTGGTSFVDQADITATSGGQIMVSGVYQTS